MATTIASALGVPFIKNSASCWGPKALFGLCWSRSFGPSRGDVRAALMVHAKGDHAPRIGRD
jgi:hypothetical protein